MSSSGCLPPQTLLALVIRRNHMVPANQPGQMDRWNIVTTLNYLDNEAEEEIILSSAAYNTWAAGHGQENGGAGRPERSGFINGDVSTVMSPRTVLI